MPYGVRFEFAGVSQAQYDALHEQIKSLTVDSDRILMHIAGPTSGGWYVLEVWESKADQERFMQRVMPQMPPGGPIPSVQEFEVYAALTADELRP